MVSITRLFDFPYYQQETYNLPVALATKKNGAWEKTSSQEYIAKSNAVSRALLRMGVQKDDKIAVITSNNRTEWNVMDIGIQQTGAQNVPIYPTISETDYEYILNHSGAIYCFVSDIEVLQKVGLIKQNLPNLKEVFSFDEIEGCKHWSDLLILGEDESNQNEVEARKDSIHTDDLATIIYTSGTTGTPKGIVRDIGGHIVALKWSMKNIYNIDPGDIWWSASDIGWVVGHSYIVYGPLFHGCTTIIYEGKPVGTPDAGSFWRVISEHKVKTLFTAPTAFRAIKKEDPEGKFFKKYDLSNFESLFLAGERADPDTIKWAENLLKKPVIDHWWQTETGWAISSNFAGLGLFKTKYGSAGKAVPGYNIQILKPDGTQAKTSEMGDVVIKLPLPPGTFPTLWNADKRYKENYMDPYQGYYKTYDAGHIDEEGYIWIMSRTDDIINVAGHRLSTGSMEEVLSENNSVAECAVLGIADNLKGQIPLGLIVLKSGVSKKPEEITKECIQMVREKIGPVAAFKNIVIVKRLPKTRSGKILRGTVSKIADQVPYKMPATIDDPAILDEIKSSLITAGIIKN